MATDQIDGDTAASLLRSEYPDGLSRDETVEIVTAIGEALDYAHARGVVHAGVAPDNIVLAGSGPRRRILLTNFVVSRLVADDAGPAAITADSVTYTAPERLTGQPADGRADQYALAGTAFHLLTGRPPFAHTNPAVVISGHLSTPPPRLSATRTDLDDLDAALARALAKDPDDRYDTCLDFAAALTGAAAAVPPQPAATWPADRAMPVPEAAVGEPPSVAHTAVDSAPPVIISSWGKDKLPRARAATAPKSTSPPGPSPTQKKSRTPAAARTQAAATSDATRRWETNFWIEVGIDPIRIVLDSESLFTLRCYVDDRAYFLGRRRAIHAFTSRNALTSYLGDDRNHDLTGLSTFDSVVDAAQANKLALPIPPHNTYTLTGLSRDIESGVDAVDAVQLGLAGELALDIGDYTGDEAILEAFRAEQPVAQLISSITGGGEVSDETILTAAVLWRRVERRLRAHLRPVTS